MLIRNFQSSLNSSINIIMDWYYNGESREFTGHQLKIQNVNAFFLTLVTTALFEERRSSDRGLFGSHPLPQFL